MIKTISTVFGDKNIEMVDHPDYGEIPKTVYKYRTWGDVYHRKILTDREIFFSAPNSFNDPFDCGIDIAYHILKEPEKELEYCNISIRRLRPGWTEKEYEEAVQEKIKEGRFKDDEFIERQLLNQRTELNKRFGIFCVTPVPDNILMWAHYSKSHSGFCVGFDSEKLFDLVGGRGGEVFYLDEYPEISPMEDWDKQFVLQTNSKAKFWDYEIEYRLFKNINNGSRVKSFTPDTVTEVILGYNMIKEHRNKIIKVVSKLYPDAQLLQTVPQKRSFELEIVPI